MSTTSTGLYNLFHQAADRLKIDPGDANRSITKRMLVCSAAFEQASVAVFGCCTEDPRLLRSVIVAPPANLENSLMDLCKEYAKNQNWVEQLRNLSERKFIWTFQSTYPWPFRAGNYDAFVAAQAADIRKLLERLVDLKNPQRHSEPPASVCVS